MRQTHRPTLRSAKVTAVILRSGTYSTAVTQLPHTDITRHEAAVRRRSRRYTADGAGVIHGCVYITSENSQYTPERVRVEWKEFCINDHSHFTALTNQGFIEALIAVSQIKCAR